MKPLSAVLDPGQNNWDQLYLGSGKLIVGLSQYGCHKYITEMLQAHVSVFRVEMLAVSY